jgi:uncharacterized hydrophobic protein (TIGR00271 family)
MEQEKRDSLTKISLFEKKAAVEKLIEESATTKEFYLLLLSSASIITFGLILDNPSILIGGMLLAPLFSPLLAIGLGVVLSNKNIIIRSFINFLGLTILIIITSFIIAFVFNFNIEEEPTPEILSRIIPRFEYLLVALIAGFMGTYFWVKPHLYNLVSGIIVAVALVPPISCLGIGLGSFNREIISDSLAFFIMNFVGILLGSIVVFSLFGFGQKSGELEKAMEQKTDEASKRE